MNDAPASRKLPAGLAEPAFDPNAMKVLKERYFAKKADGTVETPVEFVWRVASAIAEPERPYARKAGKDENAVVDSVAHAFYEMMAHRDFMPNTPCLVNAGRPLSMLSACFVLPVPDSIEGIFYNLKAMALIQKSGGGCISGDARVWSTFCGIEPLEVLFKRTTADGRSGLARDNGVAFDIRDLGVRTLSMDPATGALGLKPVTHIWKFDVPAEHQMVVRMREGTKVQTSEWHPFMVLRGTALVEVRADELVPGDIVLGPEAPEAYWPWNDFRTVAGLKLDDELGWLIGFTLGDGSFGRNKNLGQDRVRWFSGETDVLDRVRAVLERYGISVGINRDSRGNTLYVQTSAQQFAHALREACGFSANGPKDLTIRIPEWIGKSPLSVVRAFLAGLMDSDGTVDKDGSPSYTSASEAMAEDVAALMSLLGYQPTIKRKAPHGRGKHATYTVLLARLSRVREFAELVGPSMSSAFRRERLDAEPGMDARQLKMPFRVWRDALKSHGLVTEKFGRRGASAPRDASPAGPLAVELSRWSCNAAGRTRRSDLLAIASALETQDAGLSALLRRVARTGQEIASVERAQAPKPFYDLSVADWNTYAAGNSGMTMIHNTGFAFSELRHQGAEVESTGKDASGPVSFMKVFNSATDSIKQGGVRRGANMGVLRVDHPDIFHFMKCKKELDAENRALWNRFSDTGAYTEQELAHIRQELLQTQINNFNISVGVTDEFMRAVKSDSDFALRDPRTKSVVQTVKAREIWDAIVEGAWQNGEPGVLFLDHPDWNPLPGLGPINATNPCFAGETLIETSDGPRRIADLVGVQFEALVDGQAYPSSNVGAWSNGVKPIVALTTEEGHHIRATADHKFMRVGESGERVSWAPLSQFKRGDRIALHTHAKVLALAGAGDSVPNAAVIRSVEAAGLAEVFDVNVPGPHVVDVAGGIYARQCGEQALHGYDSCNLGSINVGHFYDPSKDDVDWERLGDAVALSIRFLDNVIDANIYPLDEIKQMVTNNRRVGLGIMGFAELLIHLEIPYGSPEAIAFATKLMKFMQDRAIDTSEVLARERGDFPNKYLSVWANDSRPRRNAALLSIAPTGTISMIAGCSFGCEPYFGMAYTKHVMKDAEGRPQHLYYVVPLFEEVARKEGFFSDDLLAKVEENRGSLKGIAEVPKHWQEVFTTSADVTVDQHIDMLAAFQKHVCNATSKTINAPNDDTRENVSRAIFRAYEAGCKGFTYYRDGSRTEQVVTFSKDGDIAGVNRDVAAKAAAPAAKPTPKSIEEIDIEALLAKANALLEVR